MYCVLILIMIIIRFGFNKRVIIEAELTKTITLYHSDEPLKVQ